MASKGSAKTLVIFLIILVVALALTLGAIIFKDKLTPIYDKIVGNVFVYDGITWYKQPVGNLTFYSTELAIKQKDGSARYYVLRLYNDPRKLSKEQNLSKKILDSTYVSFTNNSLDCLNISSTIPELELSMFLNAIGANPAGAFTDYARALKELNSTGNYTESMVSKKVKNCSNSKTDSIIIFDSKGTEQKIYNDFSDQNLGEKENCFIIQAKGCNKLEAVETFILDMVNLMTVKETNSTTNSSNNTVMPKKPDNSQLDLSKALNTSADNLIVGS